MVVAPVSVSRSALSGQIAEEVDLLILGGGCAGLSLGLAVLQAGARLKVLILEQRLSYSHDRTWAFWEPNPVTSPAAATKDPFKALVSHRFSRMRVRQAGQTHEFECGSSTPYAILPGDRFYDYAQAVFSQSNHQVRLELGSNVEQAPSKTASGSWEVTTTRTPSNTHNEGRTYRARYVVDTRGAANLPFIEASAGLWQSFYGLEVHSQEPIFDADCVDLMSFNEGDQVQLAAAAAAAAAAAVPPPYHHSQAQGDQPGQREGVVAASSASLPRPLPTPCPILFTYVIPSSAHQALVEVTVFAPTPIPACELAAAARQAVRLRAGETGVTTVLREEAGVLPMGSLSAQTVQDASYLQVGLMAGAARPSTGYAFQRIQVWARSCAGELKRGLPPIPHAPDGKRIRMMDQVFLAVLRSHPEIAPELFFRFFKNVATPRVIRFLSGHPTWLDCLKIIAAMPAGVFLAELPRVLRSPRGDSVVVGRGGRVKKG